MASATFFHLFLKKVLTYLWYVIIVLVDVSNNANAKQTEERMENETFIIKTIQNVPASPAMFQTKELQAEAKKYQVEIEMPYAGIHLQKHIQPEDAHFTVNVEKIRFRFLKDGLESNWYITPDGEKWNVHMEKTLKNLIELLNQ